MVKKNNFLRIFLKTIALILAIIILVVGGYIVYVCVQYYRIEDNKVITINNNQSNLVSLNQEISISTYNIGFGAYSQDFSFFMDSGETLDGKILQGTGSVAKNLQTVLNNTSGAVNVIKELNTDFMFFQEVDVNATRSYYYNQYKYIQDSFKDYSNSISMNFHSAFLMYPIFNPHGKSDAGIVTLSKYNISNAVRRSLPIDESFPNKFFDLDRCFQINYLPIENSDKQLVLINIHMSAYDEGGKIRAKQLEMLNSVLKEESQKDNYVIVGGDFNHDIANSVGIFPTNRKQPEWVFQLSNEDLTSGYSWASSLNAPTCRSSDTGYIQGESYLVVIDGFIVSSNIEVVNVQNIDTQFMFSDHNPARMTFKLI